MFFVRLGLEACANDIIDNTKTMNNSNLEVITTTQISKGSMSFPIKQIAQAAYAMHKQRNNNDQLLWCIKDNVQYRILQENYQTT